MGEFENWLKSLNENGRVTYFLGQEDKVAKEAWDFQQSKIEQLSNENRDLILKIESVKKYLADHEDDGLIEGCMADDINQIIEDGEYVEKALRGEA